MAQHGPGAAGQDGREPLPLSAQLPVTDCVHARMEGQQAPVVPPEGDRVAAEAESEQLPASNDAALASGEPRDHGVWRVWAVSYGHSTPKSRPRPNLAPRT